MVLVWILQYSSPMAFVTLVPPEALQWLIGIERASVLLVDPPPGYAPLVAQAGHSVTVVQADESHLAQLSSSAPAIHAVAASAEALPFDPGYFSAVLAIQNFHTLVPGPALAQAARVLGPQGQIGVIYLTRDDSVPWVKKLRRIVQSYLPEAMAGDYRFRSVSALTASAFFPQIEEATFRTWVPSTKQNLQDNARQASGAGKLEPAPMDAMLAEIGQLYDEYARVPQPLLVPYEIRCWRAEVDQSSLTLPLTLGDEGLSIAL